MLISYETSDHRPLHEKRTLCFSYIGLNESWAGVSRRYSAGFAVSIQAMYAFISGSGEILELDVGLMFASSQCSLGFDFFFLPPSTSS